MKKTTGVSVIIPCYNESHRIRPVVDQALKSNHVMETIIVDDGSDIITKNVLRTYRKTEKITIVTHKVNRGKTAALASGIAKAKYENILLLDADLRGLTSQHIHRIVNIFEKEQLEILLCDREKEPFYFKSLGLTAVWGGEKLIKKQVFLENKDIFESKGYLFEPVFIKRTITKYRTGKHMMMGVGQTWKIEKNGLAGLVKDFAMHINYAKFLGIKGYLWQGYYCKKYIKQF